MSAIDDIDVPDKPESESDEAPVSEVQVIGKKERGHAKGAVTRSINLIDSLKKNTENAKEIREKIDLLSDVLLKFEEINNKYVATLETEEERKEAVLFRQEVVSGAEEFEQAIRMWLDGIQDTKQEDSENEEPSETIPYGETQALPDISSLEDERKRVIETLAALEQARKLEEETHNLKIEAERLQRELAAQKYRNECKLLEERKARLQEQHQLEERLRENDVESEQVRAGNIMKVDSDRVQMKSTPLPSSRQSGRLSWEPTGIPLDNTDSRTIKDALSGAISDVLYESRIQQQSMVDALQLPRKELQNFDGDTLRYWPFMRSFKTMVDSKHIDAGSKLNCLLQSCTGTARKILSCCEMMEPEKGYKRALEILESRYGNNFEIAQRWISKITERANLKGPLELREFADDLQCCKEMLTNMGHVGELDNAHSLRAIWSKLPQYLQDRWTRRNHQIKQQGRVSRLEDLVQFVVDTAEEATDPIFSRASFKYDKDKGSKRSTGSFAINTQEGPPPGEKGYANGCPACGEAHYLTKCQQFRGLRIGDRRKLVMAKGLCMNCFARGHLSKDCTKDFTCNIDGCGLKHNRFLHMPSRPQTDTDETSSTVPQMPQGTQATPISNRNSHFVSSQGGKLAMPIVAAKVLCPETGTYIDTYAMIDTGTNATYCSEALRSQLGATGTECQMEVTTLTRAKMPVTATLVKLVISDLAHSEASRVEVEATVRPSLNIDLSGKATKLELERWPHLRDLDIPDLDVDQVHLLIGQDCSDLLVPLEVKKGRPGDPFAVHTPLGWAINGPTGPLQLSRRTSHFVQMNSPRDDLQRLWEIEDAHTEEKGWSVSDHKVVETWNKSLQVVDGHYSMDIPFKQQRPKLLDNRSMAARRLETLAKRLNKDRVLKDRYTKEVHNLVEKGYAEEVPCWEERLDGKVWYLPHHPVISPKKPEKCRIVFDCAAKYGGSSLNDHVHQGPDFANQVTGVLLRFRQGTIGFTADIEAMYHQVKVTPKDRDVLRFLWFEDDDTSRPLKTFRMTAHLFGGVWSPSCANYALQQVAEEHKELYSNEVRNTVNKNFYVDDCLRSTDSLDSGIIIAQEVKELLSQRGFNLTKYVSSPPELLEHIPREDWGKSLTKLDLNLDGLPTERVLGILWNVETDSFEFDVRVEQKQKTKRGVLSTLSTVYDPLGYVSPFILQARRIFQQMCKLQKGWDDVLPKELEEQWGRWIDDLPVIKEFSVPRCIKPVSVPIKRAQLHHFSDASEYGYGAVSYIRLTLEDDSVHVSLIMAKSRLAPLKGSTIPRLELAGALEAVRLDKILLKELEIVLDPSVYWVDSQIVLWYLNSSEKRFATYVANRVAKILDHTEATQWRYIPTESNPGDDASRGLSARELIDNDRWLHGPDFLRMNEHRWPTQPTFRCAELEANLEVKVQPLVYMTKAHPMVDTAMSTLLNHYSSWFKLKKAVAWYCRFKDYLMKRTPQCGPVTVKELTDAERDIIWNVQRSLPEKSGLMKLNPIETKDGLLRVGGRLVNSRIEEKHPGILPYGHHVSKLIIRHCHRMSAHSGVERVLSEVRRKYWIIKGRKMVKGEVYRCIQCKKVRGKTEIQQMASLPESRVTPYEPAFSRVGVDFFGPFATKRGRSSVKRYGCVFTCLATRAIHIEVAHTLDTDSFIHALDRFIARRGEPLEIWSDNGTNFVGAQQELRRAIQEWNQDKIHQHLLRREIMWRFNPPSASHMGGVWERQIRTIRNVLSGIVMQQSLDDEALVTLMTVVEGIVNNRPITKLSEDPKDERPLTPNHILMLREGPLLPPGKFVERDRYRRRWKQVQYLADEFWRRWLREYLPALQERQKWFTPKRNLEIGDLVLVKQENTPRNQWPLGLLVNVHKGSDDLVRSVEVKTSTGTYERPVTKICLLECVSPESDSV